MSVSGAGETKVDGKAHEEGDEVRRRGGLDFHIPILKNDFFENHLESFPDC